VTPRLSLNLLWLLTIPLASARPSPAQSQNAPPRAGQGLALSINPTVPQADTHADVNLLATPARLVVDDMPLESALRQLAASSGVQLDFSPSALSAHAHVRCDCARATVGDALGLLLAGTGLRFSALGQHVLITRTARADATPADQQERTITGHVFENETSQPLGSASVIIKGTTLGTHTKPDGSFSLPAPDSAFTLQVRLIGYLVVESHIDRTQGTADFHLSRDVLHLNEIVVTSQATSVARRNAANAVATVNADELTQAPTQSVDQALQGKVVGADISSNTGAPGGGMQIRLRGITSVIGSATPLYVVDGVIVSDASIEPATNLLTMASPRQGIAGNEDNPTNRIADLDPADIETIEVLKGASAAAVYGAKASNGVIVITTKRGKAGATRYTIKQNFGLSEISRELGSRTFANVQEADSAFGPTASQYFVPGKTYDNEDALAGRKPLGSETTISAAGGNESTQFYASGILNRDPGIIQNTFYNKSGGRLNLDHQVGKNLKLTLGDQVIHSNTGRGLSNNDNVGAVFYAVLPFTPSFFDLRPKNGVYPVNPFAPSNPIQTAALLHNYEEVWRNVLSLTADWSLFQTPTQSLKIVGTGGADIFNQRNTVFAPPSLQFEANNGLPGFDALSKSENTNANVGAYAIHTYTPKSGAFGATTTIGAQDETTALDVGRTLAQNLIGGLPNAGTGTAVQVNEDIENIQDIGLFGQEEVLTLRDKLLLTVGARADQSSANSDTRHLYFFPKAAASYRFTTLIPGILDELKVRAAYGESGNRPLYGQKYTLLGSENVQGLPGLAPTVNTSAPSLEPERQQEIELGFDAQMFHSKATFEATVYQKEISDLLLQRTLSPSSGYLSQFFNGGTMQDRGLEVGLTVAAFQSRRFDWTIRATVYHDGSVIQKLPVPAFVGLGFGTDVGTNEIQQGKSATQIVGNLTQPDGTIVVGQVGDFNPRAITSLQNTFRYRDLHLGALFSWKDGGDNINVTKLTYDEAQTSPDYADKIVVNGVTMDKGAYRLAQFPGHTATYVEDASYVKLREVNLTYDLPAKFAEKLLRGAHTLSLTLSGRNLITFTHYDGTDPEVSHFGNQPIARNFELFAFPSSRSVWLGVQAGF
jgi:TonB-linked SusC/RagA family outer membrane protein